MGARVASVTTILCAAAAALAGCANLPGSADRRAGSDTCKVVAVAGLAARSTPERIDRIAGTHDLAAMQHRVAALRRVPGGSLSDDVSRDCP